MILCLEEVTDGLAVRVGVSVTWNVLSWSRGHEWTPVESTWRVWYFCPKSYLNQNNNKDQYLTTNNWHCTTFLTYLLMRWYSPWGSWGCRLFLICSRISPPDKCSSAWPDVWDFLPCSRVPAFHSTQCQHRRLLHWCGGPPWHMLIPGTEFASQTVNVFNPHSTNILYRLIIPCGVQLDPRQRFALTKMKQTVCIYFTYQTSHDLLDISYEWESEKCHSSTLEQLFCHISKKWNGRLSQMRKIFNTP